jgi:hypothetical protein
MHELIKKEIEDKKETMKKHYGIQSLSYTPLMAIYVVKKNINTNIDTIVQKENIRESLYNYLDKKNNKKEENHYIEHSLNFIKENLVEKEGFKLSYYLVDYTKNTSDLFLSFNVEEINKRICQIIDDYSVKSLSSYKGLSSVLSSMRDFVKGSNLINDSLIKDEYTDFMLRVKKRRSSRATYIGLKNDSSSYIVNLNENQSLLIKHIKRLHSMLGYGEIKLSIYDRHNRESDGEVIEIKDNIKLKICELKSLTNKYDTNFMVTFKGTKAFNDLYLELYEKSEDKKNKEALERRNERNERNERTKMEERREERLKAEELKMKEDVPTSMGGFGISN